MTSEMTAALAVVALDLLVASLVVWATLLVVLVVIQHRTLPEALGFIAGTFRMVVAWLLGGGRHEG
jgi:hypothetical protein